MPLHLVKLCVGVSEVSHLRQWVRDARKGLDSLDHTTRMFPSRGSEILDGGSLYWVIRGMILCRQPIAGLVAVKGEDGIGRCRIDFKPKIILVRPTPRRAFQGWRYLSPDDAPPDLKAGVGGEGMSESMRRDLAALGLL
jgi:hypothetical protein